MAVRDSRNRRVPGLYVRNGRYYGQLWVEQDNKKTARRFPLLNEDGLPVSTLNEAKEAFEIKRHDRRENVLPSAGRKPMLFAFIETYFGKAEVARKKPGTIQNEKQALERWKAHLGDIRVDRIQMNVLMTAAALRLEPWRATHAGSFTPSFCAPAFQPGASSPTRLSRSRLSARSADASTGYGCCKLRGLMRPV